MHEAGGGVSSADLVGVRGTEGRGVGGRGRGDLLVPPSLVLVTVSRSRVRLEE